MVHSERIAYEVQGVEMVGYLAVDETASASVRPGVLLLHEGSGQDDNVRTRADRLAALGYVAFALDYLGGGTQHPLRGGTGPPRCAVRGSRGNRRAGAGRLPASSPPSRAWTVTASPRPGFCFGGVMALELARAGVPLRAAVGFHPGFADPRPADSARITASVLMMCGAEDPVVSAEARQRFEEEMREARVADWRLEVYGGVGHSFTNPDIDARGLPAGFAYDERADRRSWASMLALLDEAFA